MDVFDSILPRTVKIYITAFLLAVVTTQSTSAFKARLSPVPIATSMQRNVAGSGSVTATLVNRTLSISGSFEGLRSAATVARLHCSKVMGVRGPTIVDLQISKAMKGTIGGSIELNAEQLDGLRKGHLYIQIDSEKAPDGNLWGWLLQ